MATFDIVLDSSQELQAYNYDFLLGEADNNYIAYICIARPGHYKRYPTVGVGIEDFNNGPFTPAEIERAIRLQLENDVFKSPMIKIYPNGTITVNKVQLSGD